MYNVFKINYLKIIVRHKNTYKKKTNFVYDFIQVQNKTTSEV